MTFVARYEQAISWIMWRASFAPDKLVHTWVGLGIWLLAALALRRPLSSWAPLIVVVLAEVGNEVMDYLHGVYWTLWGTLGDLLATWFWPLVLTLVLRWNVRRARDQDASSPPYL